MNNTQIAKRLQGIKDSLESISDRSKPMETKAKSKNAYSCPNCYFKAWAKPNSRIVCGECLDDIGEIFYLDEDG